MTKTDRLYYIIFRDSLDNDMEIAHNASDSATLVSSGEKKCDTKKAVGDCADSSSGNCNSDDQIEFACSGN